MSVSNYIPSNIKLSSLLCEHKVKSINYEKKNLVTLTLSPCKSDSTGS